MEPESPPKSPPKSPSGETVIVQTPRVACDGGGGGLGHPKVFLKIGAGGEIVCPYCSRRYVLADGEVEAPVQPPS